MKAWGMPVTTARNLCNFLQKDTDSDGAGDVCDASPNCGSGCGQTPCETDCTASMGPLPVIAILSPVENATVGLTALYRCRPLFNAVQVDVNGVRAFISGSLFTASIPVSEGINSITATATDTYGRPVQAGITVTAGQIPYFIETISDLVFNLQV